MILYSLGDVPNLEHGYDILHTVLSWSIFRILIEYLESGSTWVVLLH